MSDVMTCMSFGQLMDWVLEEKKSKGTVFGLHKPYEADTSKKLRIFDRNLETPIGPAAGPHTPVSYTHLDVYKRQLPEICPGVFYVSVRWAWL